MFKVLSSFSLLFINLIHGRSFTVSSEACFDMIPKHGENDPQETVAKIQIIPHKINIRRGVESWGELKISEINESEFKRFVIIIEQLNRILAVFFRRNFIFL